MQVTLTAMGGGGFDTLTKEGLDVLRQATCLIGRSACCKICPIFVPPAAWQPPGPATSCARSKKTGQNLCGAF